MVEFQEISKTADFPIIGGAYLLLIDIVVPLTLPQKKFAKRPLAPGRYLYAGSAHGPGGLKARVSRHVKKRKPRRWHIDYVTTKNHVQEALLLSGACECDLVEVLVDQYGALSPLRGMGSSDCDRCESHFLAVSPDFSLKNVSLGAKSHVWHWKRP